MNQAITSTISYKDYITNVLYLQVDATGTSASIALQTNGAVLVPREGEEVEIHDRTNAVIVAGKVTQVKHDGSLSGAPTPIFTAQVQVYVE